MSGFVECCGSNTHPMHRGAGEQAYSQGSCCCCKRAEMFQWQSTARLDGPITPWVWIIQINSYDFTARISPCHAPLGGRPFVSIATNTAVFIQDSYSHSVRCPCQAEPPILLNMIFSLIN